MQEKMKAVVLTAPNQYGVERVDIPWPTKGEALVKIMSVAICGSDPALMACNSYQALNLPFIIGHEFAGEVVAVGEDVTELAIGDRVCGESHCGCGYCLNCKSGLYNQCLNFGKPETGHRHYGFTVDGCYAQYNAYNVKSLAKIPDNLSFDEGALCDPAGTSFNAVMLTGVTPGGYSLTIGDGPIGVFAMQFAKAMGSTTIMVGSGDRLALSKKLGADHTIDFEKTADIPDAVFKITAGLGADEVFECSGAPPTAAQAVHSVKRGGNIALVGQPPTMDALFPIRKVILDQIHIHGVRANPNVTKNVVSLFASGKVNAKDVITHRFSIDDVKLALDTFVSKDSGAMKVLIHPWSQKSLV
ncbi:MAG: alcohol dehydrogenase catalytic domain-containing protein [Oscillospiraceae bacterium]|nr:alcohol dehydrogenase catalytic domain-containing protein [Oscillospiraceae bacterium]